jgi:hypothetical protein
VFVQPRFQSCRRFPRRVLPPCRQIVSSAVTETGRLRSAGS